MSSSYWLRITTVSMCDRKEISFQQRIFNVSFTCTFSDKVETCDMSLEYCTCVGNVYTLK